MPGLATRTPTIGATYKGTGLGLGGVADGGEFVVTGLDFRKAGLRSAGRGRRWGKGCRNGCLLPGSSLGDSASGRQL